MRLHFLGASRQVTGSRYLLEAGGLKIMVDCGMFQEREFLARNWDAPPVDPSEVDVLLLTHGHLDHCGLIPRLVASGYEGPIITSAPSVDLAKIIMLDAARIQEEDAEYKRKRHRKQGHTPPRPPQPLYTTEQAKKAVTLLEGTVYEQPRPLGSDVSVTFHEAGHILGSASLQIAVGAGDAERRIIFSGDIGQWGKPLIRDPKLLDRGDYVVMESTYGDRDHRDEGDVADQMANVINDTVRRGGNVVIPTFAVERAQELMFHLGGLVHGDRIPDISVFLDSPMAVDVTEVFRRHRAYLDRETRALFESGRPPLRFPGLTLSRTVDQSRAINGALGSNVIMSTSGMCTAGRIKHHLRRNVSRSQSTVLFVGYQAIGTLGRLLVDGHSPVRIHGRKYEVKAQIRQIHGFSAHGDRGDLLRWLEHLSPAPRRVFLTHGEADAAESLAKRVRKQMGVEASVPAYGEVVELD
ncbi:MAG: MBL fold hydrolase [Phycisphaeraceae bacterium]|nr:MBL fold hydrolase [Phycisphaeraceae bacterium]